MQWHVSLARSNVPPVSGLGPRLLLIRRTGRPNEPLAYTVVGQSAALEFAGAPGLQVRAVLAYGRCSYLI
eukprot:SAG31_NODE_4416_length_3252_cov_5.682207_2_plen_70_part_00